MKTCIVLSTLAATASIAAAQPALTASVTQSQSATEPAYYAQAGAELGGTQGALILGETAEGGVRIDGPLWAHAMVVTGSAGGVDELTYTGSVLQVRAGLEARTCGTHGIACAVGGVDVAYSHTQYMAEEDNDNRSGGEIIPRIGLDVGGKHVRVRPGLELGFDRRGTDQLGVTAAVAYQW